MHLSRIAVVIATYLASFGAVALSEEIVIVATNCIAWSPSETAVSPGDIVTFRMDEQTNRIPHGIRFEEWASVKDAFEIQTVTGQQPFSESDGENVTFTAENSKILFKATLKEAPDGIDEIAFVCIVHGSMKGKLKFVSDGEEERVLEKAVSRMSPNVQRRMLRFVNQARNAKDLTQSPQERREKFEHGPSAAKPSADRRHEKIAAYNLETAKAMISNRPLNGYTDVRECLKLYTEGDSFDSEGLGNLLNSLGPEQFGEWREVATVAQFQGGEEEPVMHAALLNTNKVLLIPDNNNTVLWDLTKTGANSIEILPGGPDGTGLEANLFCSGHSFLSDGKLLVVGGGGGSSGRPSSDQGWIFDPGNSKWSKTPDMSFRRWYPTLVTLSESPSRVLIAGGLSQFGPVPTMELYSADNNTFQSVSVPNNLTFEPTYPGLHLLPDGKIFHVPVGWGDPDQSPHVTPPDPTALFTFNGATSGAWTTHQNNPREKGMSALLIQPTSPFVRGLVIGGGNVGTIATGQTTNLTSFPPEWDEAFPLLESRIHPNVVVLPDDTVFICGGMETARKPPPNGGRCELYNPATGSVTEMDELDRPRHYHSVAILLPTGEVMATGGARDGGGTVSIHNTIEIFRPPYLFRGDRPAISSVRKEVERGAAFEVDTANPSDIGKVVLARPMAVTHQTDSEQRMVTLSFSVTGPAAIEVIAPAPTSIAPPGYYMLFILNHDGVPSIAKWIRLL